MSLPRTAWVLALALGFASASPAFADEPDPLRLVPADAELVLKIESPRQLVESITTLDAVKALNQFEPFREVMDSTNVRRFFQLLRYYERELGADWPQLLDQVAGRGVVVAVKYGKYDGNYPVLIVIQGRDPTAVQKFAGMAVNVVEQELARNDQKADLQRKTHRGAEVVKFSSEVIMAVAGDAILIANKPEVMERALELREKGGPNIADNPSVRAAKKLLAEKPLAWLWYNFEPVKEFQAAKDLFVQPRNDVVQTILFSGILDVLKRSPFISAGFYAAPDGIRFSLRMPAGLEGRSEETEIHLPAGEKSGTLPLLEPKGVLFSHSFYFDFGALWDKRDKVFPAEVAKSFGELDANASRFLPGTSVPKLFRQSGPYHRFVVTSHRKTVYAVEPKTKLPGFGFVTSMRDPAFGKSMEMFVRTGVLLAGAQLKLKLVESEHNGIKVVGYKFPEDGKLDEDTENLRFNFTPCFARVNDQFVSASTFELCRELIDLVKKEGTAPVSSSNMRMRVYAEGNAESLNDTPDQLLTQFVLDQAIPIEEAQEQVRQFLTYLKTLGWVGIEYDYRKDYFELAIQWKHK